MGLTESIDFLLCFPSHKQIALFSIMYHFFTGANSRHVSMIGAFHTLYI